MKILVIGSGAKDHAIAWMFSKSRRISGLYIAPGNAGTNKLGTNLPTIGPADSSAILSACKEHHIDYIFAGTETPLAAGVVNVLQKAGYPVFGAPKNSLKLESDRVFARSFMERHGIPCSSYTMIEDIDSLAAYLKAHPDRRFVIKRNGLAPSREMLDSAKQEKLLSFASELLKDSSLFVEEFLKGIPLTITVLTDGTGGYLMLPNCSEYTKSETDDRGAATGGMGAVCPVPILDQDASALIRDTIVEPTLAGMEEESLSYKGVFIFSIILQGGRPVVVDYHVRFNDPATQALLPLIRSDFLDILESVHQGSISRFPLELSDCSTVAVVLASRGYPQLPETGKPVTSLPYSLTSSQLLFYGAVENRGNELYTSGGRCFTAVGLSSNIIDANTEAYALEPEIEFEGKWFRSDIGNKFFEE